ncbi:hypothetical protein ACWCXB_03860 [Streptomyces sp. NPDC001514]
MNVGPAVGVAAATMLMSPGDGPRCTGAAFTSATGPALLVLAAGALLATRLPQRA